MMLYRFDILTSPSNKPQDTEAPKDQRRIEQEKGVKIGIIYLLSGFGGSVLSSLFIRNSISIGASSALVGLLGAMLSELITNWTLYSDKENIRRCVRIIYDPSRSDQGVLALKALKLSDSFMELYRSKNFTIDKYESSS
ncbi:hypothetical protein RIF29_04050 [Crotalaria pallida]|uniref:RHOMBOID-like protein n=1 Tax=Crotalaria pallida TaxID=3830 RepID=A0AAN9J0M9_CROPI